MNNDRGHAVPDHVRFREARDALVLHGRLAINRETLQMQGFSVAGL